MFNKKSKYEVKTIYDRKTGIMYVKVYGGQKEKRKPNKIASYWSTSLLIHDRGEEENRQKVLAVSVK